MDFTTNTSEVSPHPTSPSPSSPSSSQSTPRRIVKFEDALQYLDAVKKRFHDRPHVYNQFLDIMKDFKSQKADTPGVIARVSELFKGHADLLAGFNDFLPAGYKIEVPDDVITHGQSTNPLPSPLPLPSTSLSPPSVSTLSFVPPSLPSSSPHEVKFTNALDFLDAVKQTFSQQPQVYNQFLDIMKDFKAKSIEVPEVISRVTQLFNGYNNLILGFNFFLPPGYKIEIPNSSENNLTQLPSPNSIPQGPPDFAHARAFVKKVKTRFSHDPSVYRDFLECLHSQHKGESNQEICKKVEKLFEKEPDLIEEFKLFLPTPPSTPTPPLPSTNVSLPTSPAISQPESPIVEEKENEKECPMEKNENEEKENEEKRNKKKSIFDFVGQSDLQGLVDLLDNGSDAERNVDATDHRGNSLLHIAALRQSTEIVSLLISRGATVDKTDTGFHTPLHFAANEGCLDIVKILVENGASLSAENKDVRLDLKGIPLFVTGGKTPLHFAAEQGYEDCVEYLVQRGSQKDKKDNDGYSPVDLAYINQREECIQIMDPYKEHFLLDAHLTKEQRFAADYKKKSQRIISKEEEKKEKEGKTLYSSYTPLHPELFSLNERFFDPAFISAVNSQNEEKLKEILEEIHPRIFVFKMFTDEFCSKMIEEIKNFEKSGMPITRPNSMNRYGAVLDEIGFGGMMDTLMHKFITPFSRFLFPDVGGDNLNERHAFVVQYKLGEDVNLKEHTDRSNVTLNVCLGKEFTGGNLLFKGIKGTPSEHVENFEYAHIVGKGLLHLGKHIHQANNIEDGERYNLIVWCRSKV